MRIDRIIGLTVLVLLLQGCVSVDEGPSQDERASAVNVQLGIGYLQQNNLELAEEKLSKALRQDPNSASAHNAYAILKDRLRQTEEAEYHYKRATELDRNDSQAANNYGTFLCRNKREKESVKYFLRAVENPLYGTPEFAYTNAAVCLMRVEDVVPAEDYLRKALTERSDFAPALLAMGGLKFDQGSYEDTKLYLDRFHLASQPTARSLWLSIQTAKGIDSSTDVSELVARLKEDFPDSREYEFAREYE